MSRNALLRKEQSSRKKILDSGFFSNYFIYTIRLFLFFFFTLFLYIFEVILDSRHTTLDSRHFTLDSRPSTFSYTLYSHRHIWRIWQGNLKLICFLSKLQLSHVQITIKSRTSYSCIGEKKKLLEKVPQMYLDGSKFLWMGSWADNVGPPFIKYVEYVRST